MTRMLASKLAWLSTTPLGIAGAARGVLQECSVPGAEDGHGKPTRSLCQFIGSDDMAQGFDLGTEQAGDRQCFRDGDHDSAPAIGDDGRVAAQVFLDMSGAGRRIDGNRNAPGQQRPEKCHEIVAPRRQHNDHRLAGLKAYSHQAGGHPFRPYLEITVGDDLTVVVVAIEANMGSLWVSRRVPVQDFNQGRGAPRHGFGAAERQLARFKIDVMSTHALGAQKGAQYVARGLRVDKHGFRESGVKHLLDARQQLHPRQAV